MPNPTTAAEWAHKLPCQCDEAYTSRGLKQPDCPRCQWAEEVQDWLEAYARQQVEAFRERAAQILDKRIKELRTYRLARNTYVPAICRELELDIAAIRAL